MLTNMSHGNASCPTWCFGAVPDPCGLIICPLLPQSTLCCTTLIISVDKKIHHSVALPTPQQFSTSLVSTTSRLGIFSLSSIFFFPQNYEFCSPDFVLLALPLLWYLDSITSPCALVLYQL